MRTNQASKLQWKPDRYRADQRTIQGEIMTSQSEGYIPVIKYGTNTDIDTGAVPETVWAAGGLYVWPTAVSAFTFSSSSGNDTALGSGVQEVTVEGIRLIDGVYTFTRETCDTDGGNTVTSADADWWRIFRAYGGAVGAGGENAGTISFTIDSKVVATISIDPDSLDGEGQTLQLVYTVYEKAKYKSYFTGYSLRAGKEATNNANIQFKIRHRVPGGCWRTHRKVDVQTLSGPEIVLYERRDWKEVAAGEDWEVLVTSTSKSDVTAAGTMHFNYEHEMHRLVRT